MNWVWSARSNKLRQNCISGKAETSVGTLHYYFLLKYGSSINYSAQRNTERCPENPLEVITVIVLENLSHILSKFFCTVRLERVGKTHKCSIYPYNRAPSFFRQELIGHKEPKLVQRLSSWHPTEARWSAAIWRTQIQGRARKTSDWIATHCHLPLFNPRCLDLSVRDAEWKGSPINARSASKPSSDRRVIVWMEGIWGALGAVCLYCEVARNLQTLCFSSNSSPSLLSFFKESLAFVGCEGICQNLPSLERERANPIELMQVSHNHECASSSHFLKMHSVLRQASRADCAREGNKFWRAKQTSLLSSHLSRGAARDWLHLIINWEATSLKVTKSVFITSTSSRLWFIL